MTWSAVGSAIGGHTSSIATNNQASGNLLVVEVCNFSNNTVWCSGLSGGGATWTQAGITFQGTTNAMTAVVFFGKVTATGAGTITVSWSGTAPATIGVAGQEFHSTVGTWALDKQGNLDGAGSTNWVSLTPAQGSGELYFGYAANGSSAVAGSTSGYTYNANPDGNNNGMAYNASCPNAATFPVWGDALQLFGTMVLVQESIFVPSALALNPLPPGWFPGADRVTTEPGGIPWYAQPAPTDEAPAVIFPSFPEAAAVQNPLLPPGWFPGADRVTTEPGGIPFYAQPGPADPSQVTLLPPAPDNIGIADWLPLPPGYFPGSQTVTIDPGGIPFYPNPVPLLPPPTPPPPPYLAAVAGSGSAKYFTDQYGNPYLLRWDTVWGLIGNAGNSGGATTYKTDMDGYCSARAAEGFNGFLTTPVGALPTGTNADGTTWDGVAPFTSPGVLNNTFWTRVDYLVNSAAASGMTVVLNVMFTYAIHDTGGCLNGWTSGQYQNYGAAVGARYATAANVVWELGDDYGAAFAGGQAYDAAFTSFVTGLRSGGSNQLLSTESMSEGSSRYSNDGAQTFTWAISNAQWNWCYGYNTSYNCVEGGYTEVAAHAVPPLVNCRMDGWYDNEGSATTETTELYGRKSIWWSLSSGSRGYMYGQQVVKAWPANVLANGYVSTTPGAQYMQPLAMKAIFDTFASISGWHLLIPDTSSALVTAGRGTRSAEFAAATDSTHLYTGGNTYVTASVTPDSSLAVLYLPGATTITINQALLGPGYAATWIDPATGATSSATPGSTYNSTAKGNNSQGDPDWVLVLQGPPVLPAAAGLPDWLPQPPGWFPGADRVTAIPGGIPFAQVPAPTDQNAPAGAPALNVNAGLATGTGAAQAPVVAIGANDVLASGTGTAQGDDVNGTFTPAAGANAALAAGTGTAQQPVAAIAVNDTLATGTGTAQQPVAAAGANTGLASGTGTAQSPVPAIAVNDTLATGTGTAQPPVAAVAVNDTLATAVGTAQSPVPAVAVNDTLATSTGTAQSPVPAIAVNDAAGPALGTGTALSPGVAAGAALPSPGSPVVLLGPGWFPGADRLAGEPGGIPFWAQPQPADPVAAPAVPVLSVSAGLASGTGTAQAPVPAIGANDTAGPAPGTGTAPSPLAAVAVSTVLASGAGAALDATVSIAGGAVSPALETFAFGPFPQIPPGSVIASVTVIINQWQSTASMGAPSYQLWDGTSAQIGATQTGVVSTSPDHEDQATFTGITYAQLGTLRVRTSANQGSSSSGAVAQVGWVSLVVTFTPAGNATAVPALLNAVAGFGLAGVSTGETAPPAVLAATAGFPQCTAGLLAAAALPAVLNAAAAFPQSAVATGQTATPATLNATAAFPAVAILLAASVLPPAILAAAGFPQCAVSTGETVPAATLAATATVPQCTAGLLAATALPALLSAAAGFPPAAASGVVNASLAPAILAASAAIPACLVIASSTGPDYAGNAGVLAGGTGTWTGPAGATGPPDPADAAWTVP